MTVRYYGHGATSLHADAPIYGLVLDDDVARVVLTLPADAKGAWPVGFELGDPRGANPRNLNVVKGGETRQLTLGRGGYSMLRHASGMRRLCCGGLIKVSCGCAQPRVAQHIREYGAPGVSLQFDLLRPAGAGPEWEARLAVVLANFNRLHGVLPRPRVGFELPYVPGGQISGLARFLEDPKKYPLVRDKSGCKLGISHAEFRLQQMMDSARGKDVQRETAAFVGDMLYRSELARALVELLPLESSPVADLLRVSAELLPQGGEVELAAAASSVGDELEVEEEGDDELEAEEECDDELEAEEEGDDELEAEEKRADAEEESAADEASFATGAAPMEVEVDAMAARICSAAATAERLEQLRAEVRAADGGEAALALAEAAARKRGDLLCELLGVGHSVGQGVMNKVPGLIISKEARRKSGAEASVARRCGSVSLSVLRKLLQDVPRPDGYGMVAPASWGEDVPVEKQMRIPMKRYACRGGLLHGVFYLTDGTGQRQQFHFYIKTKNGAPLREPATSVSGQVRVYSFSELRA